MFQGDQEEDMDDEQGETSNQGSVKVWFSFSNLLFLPHSPPPLLIFLLFFLVITRFKNFKRMKLF